MGSSLTKGTVRVQVRKDDASDWTSADPTLAVGEFGFESDTGKLKIGDGSTAWTSLAYLGGTSYWMPQWSLRWYSVNTNWYFPSTTYGPNYNNANSSLASSSLPSIWNDAYNPCIVVPKACTLTDYTFQGNFTSAQTYEFALMRGAAVTFGSAGNYSLAQIGVTQSQVVGTANIQYRIGETGLSQALAVGDILVPCLRRSTNDAIIIYYPEQVFSLIAEIS